MNAAAQNAKEPEYKPSTKLLAAHFVESVPFVTEASSVSVGRNADSILPARLEKDGTVATVEAGQRSDGIVVRKKHVNLATQDRRVMQVFIPWANVKALEYGA